MAKKPLPPQDFAPFPVEPSPIKSPMKELDAEEDIFDPFGLGASFEDNISTASPRPPPELTRLSRTTPARAASGASPQEPKSSAKAKKKGSQTKQAMGQALPPKLLVRFTYHEEISSIAKVGAENEGSSDVSVEGSLRAFVQSSDVKKNSPFMLVTNISQGGNLEFRPNKEFVSTPASSLQAVPSQAMHLVKIPKTEIGSSLLGNYALTEEVQHMPILVERKVTIFGTSCRIAVQVRSKLTNEGSMKDFTIAVAVPESIDGESVQVLRGSGEWDELKRTIKWKAEELPKGESFMVSATCQLWSAIPKEDHHTIRFPVLLRCSSADDKISSVQFRATEAEGHPATVVFSKQHSFRLLHRLT